jgi:translocation and assembly module TamB
MSRRHGEVDGTSSSRRPGAAQGRAEQCPVTGEALAHYDGKREVVNIQHVILLTPQSSTEAIGHSGVNGAIR